MKPSVCVYMKGFTPSTISIYVRLFQGCILDFTSGINRNFYTGILLFQHAPPQHDLEWTYRLDTIVCSASRSHASDASLAS